MADGQDHPAAWGLAPQTAHRVDIQVGHEQPDFFRRARREPHQLDQVAAVAHIRAHGLGADPWVVGWQAEHVPEVPVGPPALRRPGEVRQLREPADHRRRGTRRQHDQQPRRGAIAEHRGPLDDAGTGARSPVRCLEPALGRPRGFRRRLRALARRHWRVVVANPRATGVAELRLGSLRPMGSTELPLGLRSARNIISSRVLVRLRGGRQACGACGRAASRSRPASPSPRPG